MSTQVTVKDGSKPNTASTSQSRLKQFKFKNLLLALAILGLVIFAFEYIHTRNQLKQLSNPAAAGKTESQQIISQIAKSVALPIGETPTLATVNDSTKLQNQNFFKRAVNGDKVLIYSHAGQAVLYRPSTKQVIEYAPVSFGQ